MTRWAKYVLSLLLLLTGVALVGATTGEKPAGYSTEVSIQPSGNDVFLLKAKVKNAVSGELIAAPTVKIPAGQTAKVESAINGGETVVTLSANVEGPKHSATYTVTVKKGKQTVSEHSANIAL